MPSIVSHSPCFFDNILTFFSVLYASRIFVCEEQLASGPMHEGPNALHSLVATTLSNRIFVFASFGLLLLRDFYVLKYIFIA